MDIRRQYLLLVTEFLPIELQKLPIIVFISDAIMTLTTIGLGDFVAGANDDAPVWYRILLNIWLLLGLGWLSMIISLLMHMVRRKTTKVVEIASRKVEKQVNRIHFVCFKTLFRFYFRKFHFLFLSDENLVLSLERYLARVSRKMLRKLLKVMGLLHDFTRLPVKGLFLFHLVGPND